MANLPSSHEWACWSCPEDETATILNAALDSSTAMVALPTALHDHTYAAVVALPMALHDQSSGAVVAHDHSYAAVAALPTVLHDQDGCVKRKAEGDSQPSKRSKNGELSNTLLT